VNEKSVFERGDSREDKITRAVAGSAVSLVLGIAGGVFYLLMAVVGPRILRAEKMGILGPVMGIFWAGAAILSLGIPQAVTKYVSEHYVRDPEKSKMFVCEGIRLLTITGLIIFVGGTAVATVLYKKGMITSMIYYPVIALLITLFTNEIYWALNSALNGYQRLDYVAINNFVFPLVFFISSIALVVGVQMHYGIFSLSEEPPEKFFSTYADVTAAIFGFAIGGTAATISAAHFLKKMNIISLRDAFNLKVSRGLGKKIIKFGGFVTVGNMFYTVGSNIDMAIVGLLVSLGAITYRESGYYSVAHMYALASAMIMPITWAFLPAISEADALKDRELLDRYFTLGFKFALMLIVPITAFYGVMSTPILSFFAGKTFASAGRCMFIIAVGAAMLLMFYLLMYELFGLGKPLVPAISIIVATFLETVTIYVCGMKLGIEGAAIGFVVLGLSSFLMTFIYMKRKIGVKFHIWTVINPVVATIPATLLIHFVMPKDGWWAFFDIIVFSAVYFLFWIFVGGVDSSDIQMTKDIAYSTLGQRAEPFLKIYERIVKKTPLFEWYL